MAVSKPVIYIKAH